MSETPMTSEVTHPKTLRQRDLILFTVSAILLLDTLTAAASVGAPSVAWWILLGIIFFIPFAMICAEMGCAYPEQGGIYAWIRDGYGGRWGARASWCYWVNTAVWMPACSQACLNRCSSLNCHWVRRSPSASR